MWPPLCSIGLTFLSWSSFKATSNITGDLLVYSLFFFLMLWPPVHNICCDVALQHTLYRLLNHICFLDVTRFLNGVQIILHGQSNHHGASGGIVVSITGHIILVHPCVVKDIYCMSGVHLSCPSPELILLIKSWLWHARHAALFTCFHAYQMHVFFWLFSNSWLQFMFIVCPSELVKISIVLSSKCMLWF